LLFFSLVVLSFCFVFWFIAPSVNSCEVRREKVSGNFGKVSDLLSITADDGPEKHPFQSKMKLRAQTTKIWSAVTRHRFGFFGDLSPKQRCVQPPGEESRSPLSIRRRQVACRKRGQVRALQSLWVKRFALTTTHRTVSEGLARGPSRLPVALRPWRPLREVFSAWIGQRRDLGPERILNVFFDIGVRSGNKVHNQNPKTYEKDHRNSGCFGVHVWCIRRQQGVRRES
jgi:hypothetical protein